MHLRIQSATTASAIGPDYWLRVATWRCAMRSVRAIVCPTIMLLLSARAANAVFYTVTLLHPSGFYGSQAFGVSGNSQAGVSTAATGSPSHATLWSGTAASYVDLHPA